MAIIIRRFSILVAALLFASCASVPMAPPALDLAGKQFQPPEGQAALYIVYPSPLRGSIVFQILVDGVLVGAVPPRTYGLVALPPGSHVVTSITNENQATLSVVAEAGHTYFVRVFQRMGLITSRVGLEILHETEGREAVLGATRIEGIARP